MTSKIKVDNIENQCGGAVVTKCGATTTISGSVVKADDIQAADGGNLINQCGTTITLGASGDTISLAAGASQTGFGRTGTVDWDTTAKTASFTAVSGNGYFVNSGSGAITVTLPASPSVGDIVSIADYGFNAATNNITIGRNSEPINGFTENGKISTNGGAFTLVYADGTKGWITVNDATASVITPAFITATGGTVTCCGDYKIHTFTGPGTFCVSCGGNGSGSNTVDYMVVAGGGGGGDGRGGGGGGGGFRESSGAASGGYSASPLAAGVAALPVTASPYPITVGGGGAGATSPDCDGNPGNNSIFSTITSTGGGKGGGVNPSCSVKQGGPGGSGGGAGGTFVCSLAQPGGTGNTPPVSPPQGNNGGDGVSNGPPNVPGCQSHGATGGGAGGAGSNATGTPAPGAGGVGVSSSITGSSLAYAGGAGGASDSGATAGSPCGTGGDGQTTSSPAKNGTTNRGGGGGGVKVNQDGGSGGSGIVIIRYKFQ